MASQCLNLRMLALGLFASGAVNVYAASSTPPPAPTAVPTDEYITLETPLPLHLPKQSETSVSLKFKVAAGFHVQANPASTPQLIPTTLQLPAANNLDVRLPIYPKGKAYRLQGSNSEISTYEGVVEIKVPVKTAKATGNFNWKGKLRYQACNEKTCFFPKNLTLELPVVIDK